ncbi:Antitoxin component YwqK of the YwqJK toxin-antitoxin module [Tenacibaculum sp. MAR_2009_124]|uniref:hypothetical protein n=1 Tax=Tenacibaculum sp. MAR_2009_124 TaxID=1250059 RepID=UPI0008980DEE|nr:hypothetical protein [Tenacibaculum sp. MAR_2009_124]SEC25578.1 Antitoxin component YwqK of the YwqJK toxin-antitoxin module [Tenacibaculum sp. MAR_2009_124]
MKKMLLILAIAFFSQHLFSQEVVDYKELYVYNELVYKNINDALFSGVAHRKRKNNHLVYEEAYDNGVILWSKQYFNGKQVRVSNETIYNSRKPNVVSKENDYRLDKSLFRTMTYDEDGKKIFVQIFNKGKLTYSCQYKGKKKHGIELEYDEKGEKLIYRAIYVDGKKNGKEYCVCKKGKEKITEYKNGKRVKK